MEDLDARQLAQVIADHEDWIANEWIDEMAVATRRSDLMKNSELRSQCSDFLRLLRKGTESGNFDLDSSTWKGARELLGTFPLLPNQARLQACDRGAADLSR